MRTVILSLAVLIAGCSPVPPGDVVGGRAEWRMSGDPLAIPMAAAGDVTTCIADESGLRISAGVHGSSLTLVLGGDVTLPAWEATDRGSYFVEAAGPGWQSVLLPECVTTVTTGSGTWIVEAACPQGTASVVVTGCERR